MSQQSPQQRAEAYRVTLDHGIDLVGWGIRADTVVVQASGLTTPITVTIGDQNIEVAEVFTADGVDGFSMPLTALELPEGSLKIQGEAMPPHMLDQQQSPDEPMGARTFFWCLVFPRMRGGR